MPPHRTPSLAKSRAESAYPSPPPLSDERRSSIGSSSERSEKQRRGHAVTSCIGCRARKMKCGKTNPCTSCTMRGQKCLWGKDGPPPPKKVEEEPSLESTEAELSRLRRLIDILFARLKENTKGKIDTNDKDFKVALDLFAASPYTNEDLGLNIDVGGEEEPVEEQEAVEGAWSGSSASEVGEQDLVVGEGDEESYLPRWSMQDLAPVPTSTNVFDYSILEML